MNSVKAFFAALGSGLMVALAGIAAVLAMCFMVVLALVLNTLPLIIVVVASVWIVVKFML